MGKTFGLVLMLISLYIGMTIYNNGIEKTLGRVFAPIEPRSQRDAPLATGLTPAAGLADEPSGGSRPVKLTDRVRKQVTADLAAGARRHAPEE